MDVVAEFEFEAGDVGVAEIKTRHGSFRDSMRRTEARRLQIVELRNQWERRSREFQRHLLESAELIERATQSVSESQGHLACAQDRLARSVVTLESTQIILDRIICPPIEFAFIESAGSAIRRQQRNSEVGQLALIAEGFRDETHLCEENGDTEDIVSQVESAKKSIADFGRRLLEAVRHEREVLKQTTDSRE